MPEASSALAAPAEASITVAAMVPIQADRRDRDLTFNFLSTFLAKRIPTEIARGSLILPWLCFDKISEALKVSERED
jgi:hypothetical protein